MECRFAVCKLIIKYNPDNCCPVSTATYDEVGNPIEMLDKVRGICYNYTYDGNGNVTKVTETANGSSVVNTTSYDKHKRVTSQTYDIGGNITEKRTYALTADVNLGTYTSLAYATSGWRDQLISYNGKAFAYDAMGNPTTYCGNPMTWTHVRRLAGYKIGNKNNTFKYGADGIRYQKNNTVYTLNGNRILRETDGTKTLVYYYGGSGVIGFNYNGADYYYRKNLQGDVTAIYNANGTLVAEYTYDAWGKILNESDLTDIAKINPFRYRSYYYDTETGLYYLNSRYYDPEIGRFINSDTTEVLDNAKDDIGGLNLYAYCDNNPVSGRDDDGNLSFWKKLAVAVAVVAVVAVAAAVVCATAGTATPLCAIATTFAGAAKGAVIGAAVGAASGAVTGAVQGAIEGYQEDGWDGVLSGMGRGALKGTVEGAKDGFISGFVSGGFSGAFSSMAGNPMFCFVAGTTVLTVAGHRAIEDIQVGDPIYNKDWNTAIVESVEFLSLPEPVEVYNFEVEDCHTYYVGNGCWLVHNGPCTQRSAMREAKRSVNIPMSQKPDSIETVKMIGENGRTVFAKLEKFGNKFIRNDLGGHLFKDGTTLPRHYNAGIIDDLGNLIQNGLHFWY